MSLTQAFARRAGISTRAAKVVTDELMERVGSFRPARQALSTYLDGGSKSDLVGAFERLAAEFGRMAEVLHSHLPE